MKRYNSKVGTEWIKQLANKKMMDNKNLISLFEFDNTSLWWWMENWLYGSSAYYTSFEEVIKSVYTKKVVPVDNSIIKRIKMILIKYYFDIRFITRKIIWNVTR